MVETIDCEKVVMLIKNNKFPYKETIIFRMPSVTLLKRNTQFYKT